MLQMSLTDVSPLIVTWRNRNKKADIVFWMCAWLSAYYGKFISKQYSAFNWNENGVTKYIFKILFLMLNRKKSFLKLKTNFSNQ